MVTSFTPGDFLMGVRYWAAWYRRTVPAFELFRYVGHDTSTGHYLFRSVKKGDTITRSHYQLCAHGFFPFLYNTARVRAHLGDPHAAV